MKLKLTALEFNEIKQQLKDFLQTQSEFTDYNFDESGLNILVELLAYNTHYLNYYLNASVNELFLDSAQIRKNIVSIAKSLGYIPHRKKPAMFKDVKIEIINDTLKNIYQSITIPTETKWIANNYEFVNIGIINLSNVTETLWTNTFDCYEGYFDYYKFKASINELKFQKFTLPFNDVAEYFFQVFVEDENGDFIYEGKTYKEWKQYQILDDFSADSEIYFIYEGDNGYPQIVFGDNIVSKIPPAESEILIKFFRTNGKEGNNLKTLEPITFKAYAIPNGGGIEEEITITPNDIQITLYEESGNIVPSFGGTDIEEIENIRLNAPKFYASQGRAVTANDYSAIISQWDNVGAIKSYSIWGGEENTPPKYGTVFIAIEPSYGLVLSDNLKNDLKNYLKRYNIVTISPEVVIPQFIYINVNTIIKYDRLKNMATIQTDVNKAIDTFFEENIKGFNTSLKYSNLVSVIDNVDGVFNNITNLDLFIKFSKTQNNYYEFNLNNILKPNSIYIKLQTNENTYGEEYEIRDDGNGNIVEDKNGITEKIGFVDYHYGRITINDYDKLIDGIEYILHFDTYYEDVLGERNVVLKLNYKNITMEEVNG